LINMRERHAPLTYTKHAHLAERLKDPCALLLSLHCLSETRGQRVGGEKKARGGEGGEIGSVREIEKERERERARRWTAATTHAGP